MAMATLPCKKYQNCNCKKKQKKDKTWQQIDQTRQGNSLDTLNPIVFLLLRRGRHPVHSVLPLHNLHIQEHKWNWISRIFRNSHRFVTDFHGFMIFLHQKKIFCQSKMKVESPCHHCPSCRPWSPHCPSKTAQSNVACFGLSRPLSAEERRLNFPSKFLW